MVNGRVYYYVVSANTAAGESLNSNQASVTPWKSQDVGTAGVAGSGLYSQDAFTVSGSGADIWSTTDAFRFMYLTVTGDVLYYYVVSANTEQGESPNSNEANPAIVNMYLKFNETTGRRPLMRPAAAGRARWSW